MRQTVCNICGNKFSFWDEQENYSIYTTIGYGSKYDGEHLELDICCKCMDDLIDRCGVSPFKDE